MRLLLLWLWPRSHCWFGVLLHAVRGKKWATSFAQKNKIVVCVCFLWMWSTDFCWESWLNWGGAGWHRGEGAGRRGEGAERRARGRAGKRRSGFGMMTSRNQGQYDGWLKFYLFMFGKKESGACEEHIKTSNINWFFCLSSCTVFVFIELNSVLNIVYDPRKMIDPRKKKRSQTLYTIQETIVNPRKKQVESERKQRISYGLHCFFFIPPKKNKNKLLHRSLFFS